MSATKTKKTKAPKATKTAKAPRARKTKPAGEAKPKKLSAIDAAAQLLAKSGEPMNTSIGTPSLPANMRF